MSTHKTVNSRTVKLSWLASFGQLGLVSDPHIKFKKSSNGQFDHKGPENILQKLHYSERMAKTDTCLLNVTSLLRLLQTDNIVIAQTVENRQTVNFLRCRAPEAHIMKTYLFKYNENFTAKKRKFSVKKF